jgi:hypothetical protein
MDGENDREERRVSKKFVWRNGALEERVRQVKTLAEAVAITIFERGQREARRILKQEKAKENDPEKLS